MSRHTVRPSAKLGWLSCYRFMARRGGARYRCAGIFVRGILLGMPLVDGFILLRFTRWVAELDLPGKVF